jgi:hypothetical protein
MKQIPEPPSRPSRTSTDSIPASGILIAAMCIGTAGGVACYVHVAGTGYDRGAWDLGRVGTCWQTGHFLVVLAYGWLVGVAAGGVFIGGLKAFSGSAWALAKTGVVRTASARLLSVCGAMLTGGVAAAGACVALELVAQRFNVSGRVRWPEVYLPAVFFGILGAIAAGFFESARFPRREPARPLDPSIGH